MLFSEADLVTIEESADKNGRISTSKHIEMGTKEQIELDKGLFDEWRVK